MKPMDESDEGYIQLFAKKATVNFVNITQITKLNQKIIKIKAIHNNMTADRATD